MHKGGYLVKRGFAFAIDWYLSSLLFNVISGLITLAIKGSFLSLTPDEYVSNNLEWVLVFSALLASFLYYVYYPFKNSGQTLMFKTMKLKIVKNNGEMELADYFKRFYLGCFILQAVIYSSASFILQMILFILFKGENVIIDNIIFGLYLSVILFSIFFIFRDKDSRGIHDIIAGSKVIDIHDYSKELKAL